MKVFLCLFLAFSATSAQSNDYEQEYFTQDMEVDQSCADGEEWLLGEPECVDQSCGRYLAIQMGAPVACMKADDTKSGCYCKSGYARNDQGKCIPTSECGGSCPKNEVFTCGCMDRRCENPDAVPACVRCNNGCFCKTGYFRSQDGRCVLRDQCPQVEPPMEECFKDGEIFTKCGKRCEKTCDNPVVVRCPKICMSGCICKDGLVRDKKSDECVPVDQCPQKCGINEVYSECGATGCQNTCANPTLSTYSKCDCVPGCICAEGFIKDDNTGQCILPTECASTTCSKANEEWSDCGTACERSCGSDPNVACIDMCVKGCFCKSGFIRDSNGECILESDCPSTPNTCLKANEEWTECGSGACEPSCDPNPNIACPAVCMKQCACKQGFVRDSNGECIEKSDCPQRCSNPNEVWTDCGRGGCEADCAGSEKLKLCAAGCFPQCICEKGYVRDEFGQCIKFSQCPNRKCPKKETYSDCGKRCENTCDNPKRTICPAICAPGCLCNKGLVRNTKTNKCVPVEACPVPTCPKNEVFSKCGNNACQNTCDNPDVSKICKPACNSGCICKTGFLRNSDGVCVKKETCVKTCPKNEESNPCVQSVSCQESCKTLGNPMMCKSLCRLGCKCKDGYVRGDNGKCVKKSSCFHCDKNEEYSECASPCPKSCATLDSSIVCKAACHPGCSCKKGLVRNDKNKCVKPSACKVCPKGEEFKCACGEQNCANPSTSIPICKRCLHKCYCKAGYFRNGKKCVKKNQCPSFDSEVIES